MPTVAFKSRVRTTSEYATLTLIIRHRIVVGQPSSTVHDMKLSLPDGVDILLGSQLLITISGKLNGGRIPPEQLTDSCIASHLVEYLRLNADELGINAVSNANIPGDTGLLTFSCTGLPPLPAPSESPPVHAHLVGFDIDYIWQTNAAADSNQASHSQITAAMNPFSRQLSLPFLTVLNNAVGRLVTFQLVRRYPLIFGSWCKQLDTERPFFTSIFSSIVHMMERSPHQDFKDTCKKLFKVCRKSVTLSTTVAANSLSDYLGPLEDADLWTGPLRKNDRESFLLSMDNLYRSGLKRSLFKVSNFMRTTTVYT
ncbi:hypothetical protein GALMADRAFT_834527 [Galerina marginata CBS 339.88]|uniref:Uncharacterized protein n=1 Tax=Galerina marginata (strain CBS 339.88) TaxID=685588 RepID=A0A067TRS0_GALM3|nr:hypothetical protein GALMADRAFT_834527 [Galerina marginata CBS 339.88]